MSPCETYKSSRPTVEARARSTASSHLPSDYIPEGESDDSEYESDSIAHSDDADAVLDSDYESESECDGCWCGTCDLPRRPRRDFKKRQVIEKPWMWQSTAWGHDARDVTLGRRKSQCEIVQTERPSNTLENSSPSDRATIRRRVSHQRGTGSASQTQITTLQDSPKTELSHPTSSIGGADRAQDDHASHRGMYDDATPVDYEDSGEVEEAKAQGYFDHGVDAWQ